MSETATERFNRVFPPQELPNKDKPTVKATGRTYFKGYRHSESADRFQCPACGQKQDYDLTVHFEKGSSPAECFNCGQHVDVHYRKFQGKNY